MKRLLCIAILSGSACAQTAPWTSTLRGSWTGASGVTLASPTTTATIVLSADEPSNVRQAALFLASDIQNISGHRPVISAAAPVSGVTIRLVTLGHGAVPPQLNAASLQGQWESYRIATIGNDVWLVGSNFRGTAFAAYTLSERLGIDPLYLWTGYRPEHRDPLILKPTQFSQAPPTMKYRGFFHDDEDILPRPFDRNGYPSQLGDVPLEWYKRFFETALRLRMNMVAPYTRVHRRYEVQQVASDWGLYYTSHHYDILVSNPFGLERFNLAAERGVKPDYNWFTNRDGMLKFWRGGVEENKALDVIWPVGMRGTQDRPFVFPTGTTSEQRAAIFREVIQEQVKMTRALVPAARPPLFHFTMYNEMLPEYQRDPAAFDLPEDVIIVWPDDNDGHMRGLPASLGKWKHGVYYHLAYLGGNLSKQLTHTVSPKVVAAEFDKIVKAGATEYMLVNMSEVREYIMGARMIADICWDAPAAFSAPDAAARYTAWWSREYYTGSSTAADSAYQLYDALLNVPSTLWVAPNAIQAQIAALYRKVAGESPAPIDIAPARRLKSQSDAALDAAHKAEAGMTMSQQRFFAEDIDLGLEVASRQAEAALKLDEALKATNAAAMWKAVREANATLEQLELVLARAEYPPFDRWYRETWIRSFQSPNNPHRPYQQVRDFIGMEGRK